MNRQPKKIGLTLATIAVVGVVAAMILLLSSGFESPLLPDPNGYDDFGKAGQLLVVDALGYADASLEELQTMVDSNAPALALLKDGLTKEARVPLEYAVEDTSNWTDNLPHFKGLACALCAEARCELLTGNPDRAAEICLETIAFGIESCRGGVLIQRMVGIAVVAIGFQALDEVQPELDAPTCKRVTKKLEEILGAREPLSNVAETERSWSRSVAGVRDHFAAIMMSRSLKPFQALAAPAFAKCEQNEAQFDRRLFRMASLAYELDNGHPPESAADLVPEYLKAIPIDPATGDPMELSP